ncbi:MlaD family protein [Pseudonocardia alni]|uniref:MlaD family protein n=1 Tax=Pseudonocardia alni TaxID=33907 RepID=UPI0033D4203C
MRGKRRIIATVIVAVLGATGAGVVAATAQERSGDLVMFARFADASPLLVGNEVKVDGAPVGKVASMEVVDGTARVALTVERSALPVHQDAKLTIRPVSLLGERFVDLDRGTPASPELTDGAEIPAEQTVTNTDLDQILNSVDDPTGQSLAMLVTTLGEGVQGNGGNADATIRALAPALQDTDGFVSVLREQNAVLNSLVDKVQPVAGALAADDGRTLDGVVGSADALLAATASQQQQLEGTLQELPSALASARTTLDHVTGTARETTPTLASLRPTTDQLRDISGELRTFSDSLDPALASAQPLLDRGRELLDAARPSVGDLRGAGGDLRNTAAGLRPLTEDLTGNLDNVFNFIRYWAMTTNGGDGVSHYFRSVTVVNPDAVSGMLPQGLQPGLPVPAPVEDATGAVGDAVGGLTGNPPPSPNAPAPDGGLLAPPTEDPAADPGATGMNQEQESGMVDYLLGGGS